VQICASALVRYAEGPVGTKRWCKLVLVNDGRMLPRNLRRELLTSEELMSQLRLQGVETLDEVKKAYIEPDGRISVIKRNGSKAQARERKGT
jgi:uncharacterized membrane protein YcaP (DUF421 family)